MLHSPTRPSYYKSASEIGRPFLKILRPEFAEQDFERECHIALEEIDWHYDAYLFQAAAYLWRLGRKDPIDRDLRKTLWYLRRKKEISPNWRTDKSVEDAIAAIEEYLTVSKMDG